MLTYKSQSSHKRTSRDSDDTPSPMTKNIGTPDRLLRFAFAILLATAAYRAESLAWQLFLTAGALFCVFQAVTSWCAFYALIGKNTCPVSLKK